MNFFNQYDKMNQIISTSVIKQFGFQGFSTKKTKRKPEKQKKTMKHGNLETHVCFQETCLQALTKLSLGKLIPDLTLY